MPHCSEGSAREGEPGGHRHAGQIAHPGGPEYALHPADGAQPGGNAPTPGVHLLRSIPAPVLCCPLRLGLLHGGQGLGGSVCPSLGATWGPRFSSASWSIALATGSSPLPLEALWVCVAVCSGAEGSFPVWEEESTLYNLQKGDGLTREGEEDSRAGCKDSVALKMAGSCLFICLFLITFIEHLLYASCFLDLGTPQ